MPTPTKEPVLLVVLLGIADANWWLMGIDPKKQITPLLCSHESKVVPEPTVTFEEQVSHVRHYLLGLLQRGFDRLWPLQKKPSHILLFTDDDFLPGEPTLTQRVAEHLSQYMERPPVVFFRVMAPDATSPTLERLAGKWSDLEQEQLLAIWPSLLQSTSQSAGWEIVAAKSSNPALNAGE